MMSAGELPVLNSHGEWRKKKDMRREIFTFHFAIFAGFLPSGGTSFALLRSRKVVVFPYYRLVRDVFRLREISVYGLNFVQSLANVGYETV